HRQHRLFDAAPEVTLGLLARCREDEGRDVGERALLAVELDQDLVVFRRERRKRRALEELGDLWVGAPAAEEALQAGDAVARVAGEARARGAPDEDAAGLVDG